MFLSSSCECGRSFFVDRDIGGRQRLKPVHFGGLSVRLKSHPDTTQREYTTQREDTNRGDDPDQRADRNQCSAPDEASVAACLSTGTATEGVNRTSVLRLHFS